MEQALSHAPTDESVQGMAKRFALGSSILAELQLKLGDKQPWLPAFRLTLEPTLEGPCPPPT